MSEPRSRLDEVEAQLHDLKAHVEALKATRDTITWIFSVVGIILTIVLGVGAFDYLKTRSDLRKAIRDAEGAVNQATKAREEADDVRRRYAEVTQSELIDTIDAALTEQSLDSLRLHRDIRLAKIKKLGATLKEAWLSLVRTDMRE